MWRIQFWIVTLVLAGVVRWSSAQKSLALVPRPLIAAKIGYTTNFTCESHSIPISNCLWEKENPNDLDNPSVYNFNSANTRPGSSSSFGGYSYFGAGLDKGECGLVISVVKEEDNGKWKCRLFSDTGLFIGSVDVGILRKPDRPLFSDSSMKALETLVDFSQEGNQEIRPVNLTCYSANGQPPPKFQWFLDDEPLTDGLAPVANIDREKVITYFQNLVSYRFQWTDNGKKLRCVVVHDALTESDPKEVVSNINVQFAPRASRDGAKRVQVYADLGEPTILAINVSSNPRPTSIFWTVDGKQITEKETFGRYFAESPRELENGIWDCRLKIDSVEEEDINKKFFLSVTNTHGDAQFELTVSSNSAGSGGLSAGGIVGLVLGIPAILIIIAVIVVYTRARGLLCFKGDDGTSSEKERMDGDSSGGNAPEEKPTRRLSSRLSALYENLLAKKKDKTAPLDEEANKEKDKEKEANDSVAVPIVISDDKKPEDIVYAELDLARGVADGAGNPQVVVRCTDDKTEYAEIIGVVPQNLSIDETSPKKSPTGSGNSSPKK